VNDTFALYEFFGGRPCNFVEWWMTNVRNIVAQLDAPPRLPYALRSNPRILFNSFLTAGSSQSKDDVSHVGQIRLNKDAHPTFRSHTLCSGCPRFGTPAADNLFWVYSWFSSVLAI